MCPYTCNLSSGFTCGLKFWKKRLKLEHGVEESEVLQQQQQQRRQQQQQQQLSPPKQNINNNYYLYHSNNNQRIHNSQRVRTNLFEFEKDVLCGNMLQHSKTNTPPFQRESCCFLRPPLYAIMKPKVILLSSSSRERFVHSSWNKKSGDSRWSNVYDSYWFQNQWTVNNHHRYMSVMTINQNLYCNKDRPRDEIGISGLV